jgi:putative phage-type endonuclease
MKEIELEQGTEAWLEFRKNYRMASETPAVMSLSPYSTPADVRKAKRGQQATVNAAMRQGTEQEPLARASYEQAEELMRPCVIVDGDYGASLDGLNIDGTVILEVKTPYKGKNSDRWKAAEQNTVTPYDYAQMQHQLMVTGCKRADLWVWDTDSQSGVKVEVLPDPDYWNEIKRAWDDFWPTIAQRDDKEWKTAVKAFKRASEAYKKAEEKMEQAKQDLIALAGDHSEGLGVEVRKIARQGSIDWSKVQHEFLGDVDVEQYRKNATEFFKVTIKE